VSDGLEATDVEPFVPRGPARRPRRTRWLLLGLVLVVLVVSGLIAVLGRDHNAGSPAATRSTPGVTPPAVTAPSPIVAVRQVLSRQADAIVHHDRAAFLATLDPRDPTFRRQQARMFSNLRRLHFAGWSYTVSPATHPLPARRRGRYNAPTWAPAEVALHYRISGFDVHPTDLSQYPTFVRRAGRWYLASLTDFAGRGEVSATDLWDYAPVRVVRLPSVLVLGPPSELPVMREAAAQLRSAIPRVTAVWGEHWTRRVVALVPGTQREMGLIADDPGDLDRIAAVTSAEVSSTLGHPAPVGDRVIVNPANWVRLGPLGAAVVLTHELTHVATQSVTGAQTPRWLSEGFADFVGFRTAGVAVDVIAHELVGAVRSGHPPGRLPRDAAFAGSNPKLSQAYESAWLACRYLADRFGQPALVRFYRAVGTSGDDSHLAVVSALRHTYGLTLPQFTRLWRAYVRAQLAG
jgi:hypothetical protein